MLRSWWNGSSLLIALFLVPLAWAQDSGPGPVSGAGSQQYDVVVIRAFSAQQGTFTFAVPAAEDPSTAESSTGNSNVQPTDNSNVQPTDNRIVQPTDNSNVQPTGNSNVQPTSTSSSVASPKSSATAVANPSASSTVSGEMFTTGQFTADLNAQTQLGTWYAVDLGNYSLWFATADDASGSIFVTGFATPEMIAGRITTTTSANTGRRKFLRALFNSSFFFGTAVDNPDNTGDMTGGTTMTN